MSKSLKGCINYLIPSFEGFLMKNKTILEMLSISLFLCISMNFTTPAAAYIYDCNAYVGDVVVWEIDSQSSPSSVVEKLYHTFEITNIVDVGSDTLIQANRWYDISPADIDTDPPLETNETLTLLTGRVKYLDCILINGQKPEDYLTEIESDFQAFFIYNIFGVTDFTVESIAGGWGYKVVAKNASDVIVWEEYNYFSTTGFLLQWNITSLLNGDNGWTNSKVRADLSSFEGDDETINLPNDTVDDDSTDDATDDENFLDNIQSYPLGMLLGLIIVSFGIIFVKRSRIR